MFFCQAARQIYRRVSRRIQADPSAQERQLIGYSMCAERNRFTCRVHHDYNPEAAKMDPVELYDHQTDPLENTNIAKDSKNTELVARLTKQ